MTTNTVVVIDTNIFVSAVIFRSQTLLALLYHLKSNYTLCLSRPLIDEVTRVFQERFNATSEDMEILHNLFSEVVSIVPMVTVTACRDSKDNYLLELAETVHATYLITGDKDLLVLKNWKDTQILTATEMRNIIGLVGQKNSE